MDNIKVYVNGNDKIKGIMERNETEIKGDVLAKEVVYNADCATSKSWKLNNEDVNLGVEKI